MTNAPTVLPSPTCQGGADAAPCPTGQKNSTRRLKHGRFGLTEDPRGLQIKLSYGGNTLLGDVVSTYSDQATGGTRLCVRHFNGEAWPIDPVAAAVEVLG